ncbi:fungal protease inhibitor-1-like [Argiope bruennichi]|uniref:fungal protease inhibitor-1-like n=1 Tax=Argiope bruennichi TaxID=94029 RepID=UPI00249579D7|nr:fungal protease inhibitor-1-like [Argiope bruennichi]
MYQILFLLLTAAVTVEAYIACTPEICESQKPCTSVECGENETYEEKGGFCGCCPACITYLDVGEKCPPPLFVGGPPPTTKCRDDLSCQKNEDGDYVCTCTCN